MPSVDPAPALGSGELYVRAAVVISDLASLTGAASFLSSTVAMRSPSTCNAEAHGSLSLD